MNFSGWVAIPRSILNNTHTSRLSNTEQLVLMTLMLLADARTGSGYINAAAIRTYLPELRYDTAKRVLKSLEDKRLIYRQIVHASKSLYPYWIHGYQVSDGPHRLLWTNLSQVFVSTDIRAMRFDKVAPEAPLETTPDSPLETTLDGVPNNNKDQDQDIDTDKPLYPYESDFEVSEIVSANATNSVSHSVTASEFQVSQKVTEKVTASLGQATEMDTAVAEIMSALGEKGKPAENPWRHAVRYLTKDGKESPSYVAKVVAYYVSQGNRELVLKAGTVGFIDAFPRLSAEYKGKEVDSTA